MAGLSVARLGDPSDHGGNIVSASSDVTANGIGVARQGDMHFCPIPGHGTTPLHKATGTTNWTVDGRAGMNVGDQAACGASISAGSPNVFAN
jgi:uncharacterized Zn-binding protein involved in type VI secretion